MVDTALIFSNYFVAFGALFFLYIRVLMIVGIGCYILKGLTELITR